MRNVLYLIFILLYGMACTTTGEPQEVDVASSHSPAAETPPSPLIQEADDSTLLADSTEKHIEIITHKNNKPREKVGSPSVSHATPPQTPTSTHKVVTEENSQVVSEVASVVNEPKKKILNEENNISNNNIKKPDYSPLHKTNPTATPANDTITSSEVHQPESKNEPAISIHQPWDDLLQAHVAATGQVDYASFQKDITRLQTYLDTLATHPPQESWRRAEKLAYWINLYNAGTVHVVLTHYPVASIMDIDGGKTWNVKRLKVGDRTYSLDEVENQIIRPRFQDARIHFAVNCAAQSCPPLLNRAYTADKLEEQLKKQTRGFINNPNFNQITPKKLQLSAIFQWYAEDFGDVVDYIRRYTSSSISSNAKVEYLAYDWSLNEAK